MRSSSPVDRSKSFPFPSTTRTPMRYCEVFGTGVFGADEAVDAAWLGSAGGVDLDSQLTTRIAAMSQPSRLTDC